MASPFSRSGTPASSTAAIISSVTPIAPAKNWTN
jgi:hypothetical protein